MANTESRIAANRTIAQAADALTGNGTAVDVSGTSVILLTIGTRASAAAGIYSIEESFDGGVNWSAVTCTRLTDGTTFSATSAAELGITALVPTKDGPRQIRARISTNWTTASPQVVISTIN